MSTLCEIYFDNNPFGIFFSGRLLKGRVVLKFYKEKTIRGIYVTIIGKAYCNWGSGKRQHQHIGEEYYLNTTKFFVGSKTGAVDIAIRPGQYNYTFRCLLPAKLPTSVEGNIGCIEYSVVVTLDRSRWQNQKFEKSFTVLKALNLNDFRELRHPIVRDLQKSFWVCCFLYCCRGPGPLYMRAKIPAGGYTPGQTIKLFLDIKNESDQTFEEFLVEIVQLIQYFTYMDSIDSTTETIEVAKLSCGGCGQNQSETYHLRIKIPPVSPTDESTSNIVKVSYLLRIRGDAGTCHKDPVLDIPIVIGTYPILPRNRYITEEPTTSAGYTSKKCDCSKLMHPTMDSNSTVANVNGPSIPSVEDIDLPTYKEAVPVRTPFHSTDSDN